MRSKKESPYQAREIACKYTLEKLNNAELNRVNGRLQGYYYLLGMALHPAMDSTSPSHGWDKNFSYGDYSVHGDFSETKENLNAAMNPWHTQRTLEAMKNVMDKKPEYCDVNNYPTEIHNNNPPRDVNLPPTNSVGIGDFFKPGAW